MTKHLSGGAACQYDTVARVCLGLFVLFLVHLLQVAVSIFSPATGFVVWTIAWALVLVTQPREVRNILIFLLLFAPGIWAMIYLMVTWREIKKLPQPHKALGLIGGVGLSVTTGLGLIWMIVQHVGRTAR